MIGYKPLVWNTAPIMAFGSVPSAFPAFGSPWWTNGGKNLMGVSFMNSLNADIDISFDAVNVHIPLDAGEPYFLGATAVGRMVSWANGVYVRYRSAAPTAGSLRLIVWE
jgi:hypothetical protein